MRIITHTCPDCGTVVAANELARNRAMNCPGLDCEAVLQFVDLTDEQQEFYLENRETYRM